MTSRQTSLALSRGNEHDRQRQIKRLIDAPDSPVASFSARPSAASSGLQLQLGSSAVPLQNSLYGNGGSLSASISSSQHPSQWPATASGGQVRRHSSGRYTTYPLGNRRSSDSLITNGALQSSRTSEQSRQSPVKVNGAADTAAASLDDVPAVGGLDVTVVQDSMAGKQLRNGDTGINGLNADSAHNSITSVSSPTGGMPSPGSDPDSRGYTANSASNNGVEDSEYSTSSRRHNRKRPSFSFKRESVHRQPAPNQSPLTTQLQWTSTAGNNPALRSTLFHTVAQQYQQANKQSKPQLNGFSGSSAALSRLPTTDGSPLITLTVYMPHHQPDDDDEQHFIEIDCPQQTTVAQLLAAALAQYRHVHSEAVDLPSLNDQPSTYRLYLAEDDGEIDDDLPALDDKAAIGSTGSDAFAIQHRAAPNSSAAGTQQSAQTAAASTTDSPNSTANSTPQQQQPDNGPISSTTYYFSPSPEVVQPYSTQPSAAVEMSNYTYDTNDSRAAGSEFENVATSNQPNRGAPHAGGADRDESSSGGCFSWCFGRSSATSYTR